MIIFIALAQITYQKIIYNFDANLDDPDDWSNDHYTHDFETCDDIQFFGSISEESVIKSHSAIQVEAYFLMYVFINFKSYDPYNNVQFLLDDTSIEYEETNIAYSNYTCGPIFLSTISIIHQHNRRSGWIKIFQPKGGIIRLQLSILNCQEECIACICNYPISCVKWNLHQLSFNQKLLAFPDGWTLTPNYLEIATSFCGGCEYLKFQEISYSTELPPHQHILIRFYKGSSSSIQLDYMQDKLIFLENEYFVEILIKNYFNSILNLNIKTVLSTDQSWIRDFEIYYTLPEITFLSLNEGCQDQIGDRCLNCRDGWIEDEYQSNCIPICGDTIIQGYEECDDGNLISNDGCFHCKYQCFDSCKICIFGICKLCLNGFVLNENNNNCEPQCGDGIVIPYSTEQCDIKSEKDLSGCKECRYISIPYCQQSYFSTCLECYQGFSILDNVCYPYCGDKRALEQIEQLNDGNLTIYVNCIFCDQRFCRLKCKDGYEYINYSCLPICGDQIVTIEEECDDGNTIMFDGCFDCNYSCPENCHDCYQGICLECKSQYLIQESNQCKLQVICGDGLVQQQEECDDGNNQAADGCMNCLIEQNWVCNKIIQDSPSQCMYVKAPNLVINYLNMTQNKQYLNIQFNQQVKVQTYQLLSKTISLKLVNIDNYNWNSSLQIIQDVGSDVNFGVYVLEIEIYQLIDFRPTLKISLNQSVFNIEDAVLVDYSKSITLDYPKYLNEVQMEYSLRLKNTNMYLIYILAVITALSLLFGTGDIFVEILAILQYQQYLRYMNLKFPLNLEIYFSINDMISIQPLLDFINFQMIFTFINIQTDQEYSEGKIIKQNSNLIINLSSQIIQCIIFLLLMLILKWIKKVIYNWIFCSRYFECMSSLSKYISPTIIFKFSQLFYNNCLSIIQLDKVISFQGLQKALLLNGWDMIFKILLYTRNIQTNNYLDIFQIIIASIILILYFIVIFNNLKGRNQKLQIYKQKSFEIFNFIRQFLFLLFLIYVQSSQLLQLGLLLLTNIFEINLIYNYRCIFRKSNYVVQMLLEISVQSKQSINMYLYIQQCDTINIDLNVIKCMLSSFLYIEEFNQYFNEAQKIFLGWIQALILSQGIIIELMIILYKAYILLKKKCINMSQYQQQQKTNSKLQEQQIQPIKRTIFKID